jgi:hypothetical protein
MMFQGLVPVCNNPKSKIKQMTRLTMLETQFTDALKKININFICWYYIIIHMLAPAFEKVAASAYLRSWKKLWPDGEKFTE